MIFDQPQEGKGPNIGQSLRTLRWGNCSSEMGWKRGKLVWDVWGNFSIGCPGCCVMGRRRAGKGTYVVSRAGLYRTCRVGGTSLVGTSPGRAESAISGGDW